MAKALSPERFTQAVYANAEYTATPVEGETIEDLLRPEYWVHETKILRRFDKINACPDDEKWYAQFLVLEVGTGYVTTALLWSVDLDVQGPALAVESPVEVQFKGQHLKHVVIRKSDRVVLKDGISKKSEAEAWARDYSQRIAA